VPERGIEVWSKSALSVAPPSYRPTSQLVSRWNKTRIAELFSQHSSSLFKPTYYWQLGNNLHGKGAYISQTVGYSCEIAVTDRYFNAQTARFPTMTNSFAYMAHAQCGTVICIMRRQRHHWTRSAGSWIQSQTLIMNMHPAPLWRFCDSSAVSLCNVPPRLCIIFVSSVSESSNGCWRHTCSGTTAVCGI